MKNLEAPAALSLSMALISANAHTQERCEYFTVYANLDTFQIEVIDLGDEGPTIGDRRIGFYPLLNKDGEVVGQLDFEAVQMQPDQQGTARSSSHLTLQFPSGVIFYRVLPYIPNSGFDDDTVPIAPEETLRIITGGAGTFANASGTVEFKHSDGMSESAINVTCE